MRLWVAYDNSPERLPIAWAYSAKELAIKTGARLQTVHSIASRQKAGIFKNAKFAIVEIEDEDDA